MLNRFGQIKGLIMINAGYVYKGTIIHIIKGSNQFPSLEIIEHGALAVDIHGIIKKCATFQETQRLFPEYKIIDMNGSIICPGFVDTHSHMAQLNMIGCYGDGLLDWLETNTFPEEIKFKKHYYAEKTAHRFVDLLLQNGITSSVIFTTTYATSTHAMFQAAFDKKIRAIIGKVSMDRNAPAELLQDHIQDFEDQTDLIKQWHNKDQRLHYALTPRFALTSTNNLFKSIQKLHELYPTSYIQTHHSENKKEIDFVTSLFPKAKHYLDVYDQFGLLGDKTILAHSIYATDAEIDRIKKTKSIISHCPSSNLFLGSGLMPLQQYREQNIRLSIGCDIGAGTSISPWRTLNEAYKVQMLRGDKPSPTYLFYLATLGGAEALNHDHIYGNFLEGKEADFQVINFENNSYFADRKIILDSAEHTLLPIIMLADERSTQEVYIRGKKVFEK